jgi:hypothetical protein
VSIDGAALISLLSADPADRQALAQRLLLQSVGGDLASAGVGNGAQAVDHDETPRALRGLYREVGTLDAELRRVASLLADAAAALGACPRCLGSDEFCDVCGGQGTPGTDLPDVELFEELVSPAVSRLADDAGHIDNAREEQLR